MFHIQTSELRLGAVPDFPGGLLATKLLNNFHPPPVKMKTVLLVTQDRNRTSFCFFSFLFLPSNQNQPKKMTMPEGTPTFSLLSEKTRDRASLVKMNRSRERARRRSTIDGAINGAINDFLSASEHTKLWDLVDESSMQSHNSVATTGNRYPRRGSVTKFSLDSVLDNNTNFGSLNDNDDNTFIGTFEPNSKLPSFKSEQSCIQVQKRNNNPKEIFTIDQLPIPMKKKKSKKKKEKKKESSNSKINLSTNDLLNGKKKKDGSKRKKRRGSMVHPIDGPFDKPNNNNNSSKHKKY